MSIRPAVAFSSNAAEHRGMRIHASRLRCGSFGAAELARRWDVNDATYRAIEKGRRPLHGTILHKAVQDLRVSREFLLDGAPRTAIDVESGEIALRLARFVACGYAMAPSDVHGRLVQLRLEAGYATASAAATARGWSVDRYGSHESRRKGLPIDQAVRYGLAFGGKRGIDFLAFGEGSAAGVVKGSRAATLSLPPMGGSTDDLGDIGCTNSILSLTRPGPTMALRSRVAPSWVRLVRYQRPASFRGRSEGRSYRSLVQSPRIAALLR